MVSIALLLWGSAGYAQQEAPPGGFDAHGFRLAAHDGDLRDALEVQRPGPLVQGDWFFSALSEYARAPLVQLVAAEAGTGPGTVVPVVDNLLVLNLATGVAVHDRIRIDLGAPVYGLSTGVDQTTQGPAFGDLRGTVMLLAVRPDHVVGGGGFGLGVVGHVDVPSGSPARFLGQSGVAGGAKLALTYELESVTLSGDIGGQFNPALDLANVNGSDTLLAGLAVGFLTSDTVGVTIEAVGQPSFVVPDTTFQTLPPIEALLSLRYRNSTGGFFTVGAAGGLTDAPGVAAFRIFVGGGYGDLEPARSPDGDVIGTLRTTDLCPLEAENVNGWKDDDGCPDRLGALAIDVKYQGASRAADAEILGPDGRTTQRIGPQGLSVDAVPGTQWTVKATDGCLTGEASAVAAEGGGRLDVVLAPVYDARVTVEVVASNELPLPEATVQWRSARPECVPTGIFPVDDRGMKQQDLASGEQTVVVTAPGHSVVEQAVSLLPGDDKVVRVKLGPSLIILEKKQIRILEKVQFEFGKAVIRSESFALLDEVAAVIITNPDIGRVEVSGHTDNKGSDEFNQKLSEDRANSVRDYLLKAGCAPERLLAVGYGEVRPLDTNKTETGREVNRRVEFNLIDAPADPAPGGTP